MLNIIKAEANDLSSILALQKLAYQSEAELVGDYSIPPLTQTLEGIQDDYRAGTILKAIDENILIGSVRCRKANNTVLIGRLIVHPDFQSKGIGTNLLLSVERFFPSMRYELFTSNLSTKNLVIYQKNGYIEFKREKISDKYDFVYLYKQG